MNDILKEICDNKLKEIEEKKSSILLSDLRKKAVEAHDFFERESFFINSIKDKNRQNKPAIIAEIKKKSPSKGIIREDFDAAQIAKIYEREGAACISVLTDEKYFAGKNQYLQDVKLNTSIPILRKDFILDEFQIYESKIIGADCILLIMACLDDIKAKELEGKAADLGMDVLVEVHDRQELERALNLDTKLIGINNRNLKTMKISLDISRELIGLIPKDYIKICESGISSNSEIKEMMNLGFNGFLIGETLMKQDDIAAGFREIVGHHGD